VRDCLTLGSADDDGRVHCPLGGAGGNPSLFVQGKGRICGLRELRTSVRRNKIGKGKSAAQELTLTSSFVRMGFLFTSSILGHL